MIVHPYWQIKNKNQIKAETSWIIILISMLIKREAAKKEWLSNRLVLNLFPAAGLGLKAMTSCYKILLSFHFIISFHFLSATEKVHITTTTKMSNLLMRKWSAIIEPQIGLPVMKQTNLLLACIMMERKVWGFAEDKTFPVFTFKLSQSPARASGLVLHFKREWCCNCNCNLVFASKTLYKRTTIDLICFIYWPFALLSVRQSKNNKKWSVNNCLYWSLYNLVFWY